MKKIIQFPQQEGKKEEKPAAENIFQEYKRKIKEYKSLLAKDYLVLDGSWDAKLQIPASEVPESIIQARGGYEMMIIRYEDIVQMFEEVRSYIKDPKAYTGRPFEEMEMLPQHQIFNKYGEGSEARMNIKLDLTQEGLEEIAKDWIRFTEKSIGILESMMLKAEEDFIKEKQKRIGGENDTQNPFAKKLLGEDDDVDRKD